jgi:hypothetical protein
MVRKLTLRQAGSLVSVVLPRNMTDRLRVGSGDRILAIETDNGILLTPYDPVTEKALAIAAKAAGKNRNALRKLAR